MKDKECRKSITMAEIMTPNMVNFRGNVHGGFLLSFLDKVAYACASRYTGSPTVTLSVDRVFFKEPIHVGDLITCYAKVNYVGNTSLEIGIRVVAENIQTAEKRHTNTSYFTMVAVNDAGKPTPIEPLVIENEEEQRRFNAAKRRKEARIEFYKKLQEEKSTGKNS